jgi:hypothetical protein
MPGIAQKFDDSEIATPRFVGVFNVTIVGTLLFASVVVNIFLARKISVLTTTVEAIKAEERLKVGTKVPPIPGRSVAGTEQTLDYSNVQVPTVLYVFTPQCSWCAKNVDNLRTLIADSGHGYRVVGISLTTQGLKEYLEKESGFY